MGTLKFVFEKPKAGSISMKIVDQPGIIWLCLDSSSDSSSSSSSSSSSGSATGEHQCVSLNSVPAGTYIVEVSSGVATAKDFTPWTTPPLLTTFYVGEIDYCTTAAAGADSGATTAAEADSGATTASGADSGATTAAGSAAAGGKVCDFPKDVTGQLYTIPDIKTNEAGTLKFVFEKPKAGSISMKIVDQPGIIWLCLDSSSDSSSSSSSSSSSGSATGE